MRAVSPGNRRSSLLVRRGKHFAFVQAVDLIRGADDQTVDSLRVAETICKASNGEPNIRPLFHPNARRWLLWYLGWRHARWLFAGANSNGQVRLVTAYEEEFAAAQSPHPDWDWL